VVEKVVRGGVGGGAVHGDVHEEGGGGGLDALVGLIDRVGGQEGLADKARHARHGGCQE